MANGVSSEAGGLGRILRGLVDGFSYIAVIVALLAMDVAPRPRQAGTKHVGQELREGLAYAFGFAPIRSILLPALRELVRPIYRRMGILPEIATGIQAATQLRVPP